MQLGTANDSPKRLSQKALPNGRAKYSNRLRYILSFMFNKYYICDVILQCLLLTLNDQSIISFLHYFFIALCFGLAVVFIETKLSLIGRMAHKIVIFFRFSSHNAYYLNSR